MTITNSFTPPSEKDSWSTPQWLFNWLNEIFDFDLDLAASEGNAKHRFYLDEAYNSLTCHWSNLLYNEVAAKVGFCNPPYSDIKPWVKKAIEEQKNGFTTVMLIPTPNGELIYKDIFENASMITFITGRVSFIGGNGKAKGGNTRGSCVVLFGKSKGLQIRYVDRDMLIKNHSGEVHA